MSKCYAWTDYHLSGPIALSPDDYTFRAYGLGQFYGKTLSYLKRRILTDGYPVKWRVSGLWGEGKSTFAYNLCHRVNSSLYFGDQAEIQKDCKADHILSLYVGQPRKRALLLEQTINEGLPIPWDPVQQNRSDMRFLRELLLASFFRKLAYLVLRAQLRNFRHKEYISEIKESAPSSVLSAFKDDRMGTNEFMRIIDGSADASFYDKLQHALSLWLQNSVNSTAFYDLPCLLYPPETAEFVQTFNSLRNSYISRRWGFDDFLALCNLARVHVLLIIDELEEWTTVIKCDLDEQLLSMVVAEDLSMILVFRTLFPKGIRKDHSFDVYLKLFDKLEELRIPEPDLTRLTQLTEGILQTSRLTKELGIFPCTQDFVVSLATKTKRGGRFNIRLYIRCLSEILEKSLDISREKIELDAELLSEACMRDIVVDTLIAEEKKQRDIQSDRELLTLAAAGEIGDHVLMKGVPNRLSFDELKVTVSQKWRCRIPSDIQVLASVENRYYRRRLQHIIESLR